MRTTLLLLAPSLLGLPALAQTSAYTVVPGANSCVDITPDGTVVVGGGSGGAYFWRWQQDPAPTFIGEQDAVAVSDDGTVILGNMADPATGAQVAGIWTQATGWQSLGYLPNALQCPSLSSAYDLSADGSTAVGLSWDGCSGRAFRWTPATNMVELQVLANGGNRASTVSDDGTMVGGFAQAATRTPAVWDAMGNGSLYNMSAVGEVLGISGDGDTTVGTYNGSAFYKVGAAALVPIGSLNAGQNGNGKDVTNDGDLIVGYDSSGFATDAWIWTPGNGIEGLRDVLIADGLTGVPGLTAAMKVTDDKRFVVGQTFFGDAWIVTLPAACSGGSSSSQCIATANSTGSPASMGSNGNFSVPSNGLTLTASPVPDQPGLFYYGPAPQQTVFGNGFQCVGGAQVYRLQVEFASGNVLSHDVDFTNPPGAGGTVTPGSTWYWQAWFRDPAAGGAFFNLSDALEITFCN